MDQSSRTRAVFTRGGQNVLSLNILQYNFFTTYILVKCAFFTDSWICCRYDVSETYDIAEH